METVLNIGLNESTLNGLIARSGDPRFAYDAYRRFIGMFSNVVLGLRLANFEFLLEHAGDEHLRLLGRERGHGRVHVLGWIGGAAGQ